MTKTIRPKRFPEENNANWQRWTCRQDTILEAVNNIKALMATTETAEKM